MNKFALSAASALLACAPAFAQAQDPIVTLVVEEGTVMTSTGGEFAVANSGKSLVVGERVMVSEGAKGKLVYALDESACTVPFATAGVFTVAPDCAAAGGIVGGVVVTASGSISATAGAIAPLAGVAAGAAGALGSMDDVEREDLPPPVSR